MIERNQQKITLADHAELWYGEQGNTIPPRNTKDWDDMYKKWIAYAFTDFIERGGHEEKES